MAWVVADLSSDLVLIKWVNSPVHGRHNHLVFSNLNTRKVFYYKHHHSHECSQCAQKMSVVALIISDFFSS